MTDAQRGRFGPPARLGLTDPRAEAELRGLGWWDDHGPVADAEPAVWALSRSPDPDLALRLLDRLRDALGDSGWAELDAVLRADADVRARLVALAGSSTALGDHLVANPGHWRELCGDGGAAMSDDGDGGGSADTGGIGGSGVGAGGVDHAAELLAAVDGLTGPDAVRALRRRYRDLLARIAADDLAATVEPDLPALGLTVVGERLTDLADAAVGAALAVAHATHGDGDPGGARLAVIGMGKCGARELNYVSDVDVIFAGEGDERLLARLAATTMRVASAACFEMDAALRPEGKQGVLVRTVESHLDYYRRWARTWEFQALLKARPVAGDADLGAAYLDAVSPLVWQAADRTDFVADVQAMRRRVEDHIPPDHRDRELKLGRGGLRDVEFAVQLLQLVHGRTDDALRVRSTVEALRVLGRGGYVGRDDAANLTASYEFLRLLEHRLQLQRLRRTHLLPADDDRVALRWLARASGYGAIRRKDPVEVLVGDVRRNVHRVRRLHEKLFYRPLLEAVAKVPTESLRLTAEAASARLAALGYLSPDGALRHLEALTAGRSRAAAIQTALLPVLLDLLGDTPDPDGGLLAYRKVSEALATTPWYLRLLRDEGQVAQRLMHLLGTSRYVPDLLVRAPEVLRLLADDAALAGRDPHEVAASLRAVMARHADPADAVKAGRSMRRHELLRVACADLLGLMDAPAVCAALSAVWTAVLGAALDVAIRAETAKRAGASATAATDHANSASATAATAADHADSASATDGGAGAAGDPADRADPAAAPARIAVIGMGRLGGAELGYGSDADVLFVCEPTAAPDVPAADAEHDAVRFATAVAESVRRLLAAPSQDPALVVDADLRPEGRSGPLVRTLASYEAYYARWSEVWEAQALLRATHVAGDADLGTRFLRLVDPVRYPEGGLDAARVTEIRRIKARVDAERLPRGADPTTHTKLGRGGLSDIEWTVQLMQLRHAREHPGLRTTSTIEALRAARSAGLLAAEDGDVLEAAWLFATRARNAATVVRGKPTDQVPRSGRELAGVALALGYPHGVDPGTVVDDYRRTARRARAVVERVFYA